MLRAGGSCCGDSDRARQGRQLGPSTGSLNPSMRSYTHLVEAGRRRPRSTRWVNMRIKGPKHPPAGPRPPPIGLTCASKGFTCAGCIHRNRRGPDAHRRPDDPHASPETTEAGPRRIPPLVACDGRTVRTEKSRSQQHVVSLNPESPGSTVGSAVGATGFLGAGPGCGVGLLCVPVGGAASPCRPWVPQPGPTALSAPPAMGVLHYMKPSGDVSPACRSLM